MEAMAKLIKYVSMLTPDHARENTSRALGFHDKFLRSPWAPKM